MGDDGTEFGHNGPLMHSSWIARVLMAVYDWTISEAHIRSSLWKPVDSLSYRVHRRTASLRSQFAGFIRSKEYTFIIPYNQSFIEGNRTADFSSVYNDPFG